MIAWEPPESQNGAGAVLLRSLPDNEMSRDQYLGALSTRIDRLVRKEDRQKALRMLDRVLTPEGLEIGDDPMIAGDLMTGYSDALTSSMPLFPVPASKIKHDPALARMLEEESLEEFLQRVYPDADL